VRVEYVDDPHAKETFDRVLDLLADAIADLAIAEARAEVAARLGITPEELRDRREPPHLRLRDELDQSGERRPSSRSRLL
jgi:hypothetical protein